MGPEARRLHRAFVAAFPGYLRGRIAAAGLPDVEGAIVAATEHLDASLAALLERAPEDQLRSPLQLIREAVAIPTEALAALGIPAAARDAQEMELLPGDRYALAPATSRDLGDEAYQAHIAWGVAKAKDVAGVVPAAGPSGAPRRPVLALVSTDLMDRTRLVSVAESAGYVLALVRNPAAVADVLEAPRPAIAFVDLTHAASDEIIAELAGAGIRTIAYGPHVDDVAMARARSLGADQVVARSRFFRDPAGFLPQIV
jgi:hypothetical protein